jgi:carboxyl-terminal processing protease
MKRLSSLLFALPLLFSLAPAQTLDAAAKKEVLDEIGKLLSDRAFVPGVDLRQWPQHLEKQRAAIERAERDADFVAAVNRSLREFGISHVRMRTPAARNQRTATNAVGLGITVRQDGDLLVVVTVAPGSPAAEAGVQPGDLIVRVNGRQPGSPADLATEREPGVQLVVRKSEGAERELELQRAQLQTDRRETLTWADDQTAVLRVFTFSRGYGAQNIESLIREANRRGAQRLILDLRSNGGGATNNLQHLLSLLLPPDTVIGTFVSRRTSDAFARATGQTSADPVAIAEWSQQKYRTSRRPPVRFEGQIAVLTNRGSASASEIAACALREHADAPIVGTRTAGAVLASVFARLPRGYEIQIPVSDYVSAKGVRLEGNPVQPDAEVTARPQQDRDPAIEKAIELLAQRRSR